MQPVETLPQVEELRAKLGKLETALSAIVDALAWIDEDGRVQWFSAPFRRLVARQDQDITGVRLTDILPLELGGRRLHHEAHPVTLALQGQPNAIGHYEFQKGDRRMVLEFFAARVQFSKHEISTVVAIRDITQRKQAEETEKRLAAAAEASAAEARKRAEELAQAYHELQNTQAMLIQAEKMAAVGQLASGIAHEVKNPLGIILQGVNYLEMELRPEQAQLGDVLRMIKEAVHRSDKIVRDLLNFSRQAPLEAKPCDLNQIMATSIDLVEKQLLLKNITITKEFAAELPAAVVDDNQMKQVFINTMINALQAMPDGGSLTLKTFAQRLTDVRPGVGRRADDRLRPGMLTVVCEVTDTGVGIPKEHLSRVFDPFFTTRPAGEGTGLGLAITRSIVERHRGLIEMASVEGRGTTVTVTLPAAQQAGDGR